MSTCACSCGTLCDHASAQVHDRYLQLHVCINQVAGAGLDSDVDDGFQRVCIKTEDVDLRLVKLASTGGGCTEALRRGCKL